MKKINIFFSWSLLFVAGFIFTLPQAQAKPVKPGTVKVVGKHAKKRIKEGSKQRVYYHLKSGVKLLMKVQGPASIVILARGTQTGEVTFDFKLDDEKTSSTAMKVTKKASRGIYLEVPADSHELIVSCSAAVLIRPLKAKGKLKKGQKLVVWQEIKKEEDKAAVAVVTPPVTEEKTEPPKPEEKKEETKEDVTAAAATTLLPIEPVIRDPSLEKMAKKADSKPLSIEPLAAAIAGGNRPVEVRLRMLADRLGAGFAALLDKGRYERIVVAQFGES